MIAASLWDMALSAWPGLLALLTLIIDLSATCHVILRKRDTRSAIAWVGLIWLAPFFGAALYVWLGINRIQRRPRLLRPRHTLPAMHLTDRARPVEASPDEGSFGNRGLASLAHLVGEVSGRPLLPGNRTAVLNGERPCYPAMLDAIERATESISLSTYIFDNDRAGRAFQEALARATARGVQVRVIDR